MSNNAVATQRPTFSAMISTKGYQTLINNTLKDPAKAQRFIASITSAVAINPVLQECDPATILSGALLGESLGLSPSPQLGQYYLVPYDNTKKGCKDAQFQLGYKGYVQLALRSGYYKHLNVLAIKKGELVRWDVLTEEIELDLIQDDTKRAVAETIGYVAMFEYMNGFRKTIYWSKEKMEHHAITYSKGYASDKRKGTSYTFWSKDFEAMAFKTMLRQLISKWGIMSIDLQTAIEKDFAQDEQEPDYVQPQASVAIPETAPIDVTPGAEPIPDGKSLNDL